jgi:hypothetical protein
LEDRARAFGTGLDRQIDLERLLRAASGRRANTRLGTSDGRS